MRFAYSVAADVVVQLTKCLDAFYALQVPNARWKVVIWMNRIEGIME